MSVDKHERYLVGYGQVEHESKVKRPEIAILMPIGPSPELKPSQHPHRFMIYRYDNFVVIADMKTKNQPIYLTPWKEYAATTANDAHRIFTIAIRLLIKHHFYHPSDTIAALEGREPYSADRKELAKMLYGGMHITIPMCYTSLPSRNKKHTDLKSARFVRCWKDIMAEIGTAMENGEYY